MTISLKHKRLIQKVLIFGIMWLLFGFIYVLLEYGLIGNLNYYPTTGNKYGLKESLLIVSFGAFLAGCFQGCVEMFWLKNLFNNVALWKKFVYKSIIYLILVILFISIITLAVNALLLQESIFSRPVLDALWQFITNSSFWIIVIYTGFILDFALFYFEIEAHLGRNALSNYLGKYHNPKLEKRIFMFLDMKSSTSIAEKLGHEKYFELLKTYYADMTNAILDTNGEIYQYVGDEIVITWNEKKGTQNNNCIRCFIMILNAINLNHEYYIEQFGMVPKFKAGFHLGPVTAGEIGIIKKDIIYTGDVLNTTARIQSECNNYNSIMLVSETLYKHLSEEQDYSFVKLDKLLLEGKKEFIQLYNVVYKPID